MRQSRQYRHVAIVMAGLLAMAACASGSPSSSPPPTASPPAASGANTTSGTSPAASGSTQASPTAIAPTGSPVQVNIYIGGVTTSAPEDFAADKEGIFARHNLKAKYVILSGTSQAVQAVAADRSGAAYAPGDLLDIMLISANNPDVPRLIGVSASQPYNPVAVLFLNSSGIKDPSDLVGKTIGVPTGSLSAQYLDLFLQAQGLSKTQVTVKNIGFSALHPALLQHQVDAISEFSRGIASLGPLAEQQGDSLGSFLFGKFDVPAPLGADVVQKTLLDEHPDVAGAIAQATAEARYFCAVNQEQCINDFVAANPGRDVAESLAEWKVALQNYEFADPSSVSSLTALQLGWFDPDLIAKTVPQLQQAFGIKTAFDPTTLYTNQFMQQP